MFILPYSEIMLKLYSSVRELIDKYVNKIIECSMYILVDKTDNE